MQCLKSPALLIAVIFIGVSFQNSAAQGGRRLEMNPKPVMLEANIKRLRLKINGDVAEFILQVKAPCCPSPVCCNPPANPEDLGIFIPGEGSAVAVEAAYLEIYAHDKRLLFSTDSKCQGCGTGIGSKPGDKSTGRLLTLSKAAAAAATAHFVEGNTVKVHLKIKNGTAMPDSVYIVNTKSLGR
jgi:hypothetical protein